MADDYRINVRFRLNDEKQQLAADYLKSLRKSRNKFIVDTVIAKIESRDADEVLLQSIRQIFREEVQTISVVSPLQIPSSAAVTELTEEQKVENAKSVLSDLDMFG